MFVHVPPQHYLCQSSDHRYQDYWNQWSCVEWHYCQQTTKSLIQDPEQQYKHEKTCLLSHVVVVNFELDMMVPVALWNNVEIEIDFEATFVTTFEVAVEMANVEVVVVEEGIKTIDFVDMLEIGSTHQNGGK